MSKPILVGYDPRAADRSPVEFGVSAARFTGARLIVASVERVAEGVASFADALRRSQERPDADLPEDCSAELDELAAELRDAGVAVECRKVESTSAARALHELAEHGDAGLLVVGSSRRSPGGRTLLGGAAGRLIHGAPSPVAVVPRRWSAQGGPSRIAVAYVDTEEAREALHGAHALARGAGATLKVFTVVKVTPGMYLETEPPLVGQGQAGKGMLTVEGEHRVQAERELRKVAEALGDDVPIEVEALLGEPADAIADVTDGVDLLVCGSRGYGPLRAVLLGSVTREVIDRACCPVVVLPRGVEAPLEALAAESPRATAPV